MYASFGWTRTPGRSGGHDDDDRDDERRSRRSSRPAGLRDAAPARARSPTAALTRARTATRTGEPSSGMSTNGTTRLPRIAPTVFVASSPPDPSPACDRIVLEQRRRGRERDAQRDRDRAGRRAPPSRRGPRACRAACPASGRAAATRTRTRPSERERSGDDLAGREQPERIPDPRPQDCEEHRPERDPDEERREDRREHVGRVARPRGEQPGPRHLVAERGQAGDEGDGQGKARRRPSRAAVTAASARHGCSTRLDRLIDGLRPREPRLEPARARRAPPRPSNRPRPPAPRTGRGARSG